MIKPKKVCNNLVVLILALHQFYPQKVEFWWPGGGGRFRERKWLCFLTAFCVGLVSALAAVDGLLADIKAFIEFRTRILASRNFSHFDNEAGAQELIIPNYIHYIRLHQPELRSAVSLLTKGLSHETWE